MIARLITRARSTDALQWARTQAHEHTHTHKYTPENQFEHTSAQRRHSCWRTKAHASRVSTYATPKRETGIFARVRMQGRQIAYYPQTHDAQRKMNMHKMHEILHLPVIRRTAVYKTASRICYGWRRVVRTKRALKTFN